MTLAFFLCMVEPSTMVTIVGADGRFLVNAVQARYVPVMDVMLHLNAPVAQLTAKGGAIIAQLKGVA